MDRDASGRIKCSVVQQSANLLLPSFQNEVEINEILDWANGFIVVYDIANHSSFNTAMKAINVIRQRRRSCSLPVTLVANKRDLQAGRKVSVCEASAFSDQASASFFEVRSLCHSFDLLLTCDA